MPSLYVHFLRRLVAPEGQPTPSTFHYSTRTEATKNARLVVLGRMQRCRDSVIGLGEKSSACWADPITTSWCSQTELVRAMVAKDMARLAVSTAQQWLWGVHTCKLSLQPALQVGLGS